MAEGVSSSAAARHGAFTLAAAGVAYFALVSALAFACGYAFHPHPDTWPPTSYPLREFWLSIEIAGWYTLPWFSVAAVIALAGGVGGRPVDARLFPVPNRTIAIFRSLRSRLIFEVGLLLTAGYIASCLIEKWELEHLPHGIVWGPDWVFESIISVWGVLWLAESVAPPARSAPALTAAVYVLLNMLLGMLCQSGWIVT